MMTRPLTLRAARPQVWIRLVSDRRITFLVGVQDGDERDLRDVESFAQQVDADEHVVVAAQRPDQFDAFERLHVGVHVAHAHVEVAVVIGQVFGHALGQRGDEDAFAAPRTARISSSRSSTWFVAGRISTSGSTSPVGRTTCSTIRPSLSFSS